MEANEGVKVNRKYKDSLFRFLFGENRENALSLYNALNGTAYTDAGGLEYTTLKDVIYMKMKDDVSFLAGASLNLYEHQSTYNPNMPLRGLMYFADLYRKLIKDSENLYGKKLVRIPNPKYVVFYNGPEREMETERRELRLSDAFEREDKSGRYEWTAEMVNINSGRDRGLMEKCAVLREYAQFIERIKANSRESSIEEAVDKAVGECIEEGILKEFLLTHRREVVDMCLTEFDEVKYGELIREEGRREGRREGIQEGKREGEGRMAELMVKLFTTGREKDALRAKEDREYREELFREYGL